MTAKKPTRASSAKKVVKATSGVGATAEEIAQTLETEAKQMIQELQTRVGSKDVVHRTANVYLEIAEKLRSGTWP